MRQGSTATTSRSPRLTDTGPPSLVVAVIDLARVEQATHLQAPPLHQVDAPLTAESGESPFCARPHPSSPATTMGRCWPGVTERYAGLPKSPRRRRRDAGYRPAQPSMSAEVTPGCRLGRPSAPPHTPPAVLTRQNRLPLDGAATISERNDPIPEQLGQLTCDLTR